jgi:hypothetical protein
MDNDYVQPPGAEFVSGRYFPFEKNQSRGDMIRTCDLLVPNQIPGAFDGG